MAGPSRLALNAIKPLVQPSHLRLASRKIPLSRPTSFSMAKAQRSISTGAASGAHSSPAPNLRDRPFSSTPTVQSTAKGDGNGNGDVATKQMTAQEYDEISERDMDILHDRLEELCEVYAPEDWEVEYSSGVMNLSAPPNGTYVINKQPPNQQIWFSSPLSGPMRFGYSPDGKWVHHRKSDVTLGQVLEDELRGLLKRAGEGDGNDAWEGPGLE